MSARRDEPKSMSPEAVAAFEIAYNLCICGRDNQTYCDHDADSGRLPACLKPREKDER